MAFKSGDAGSIEDRERVEERRRQILAAAAAVFARSGYHQARTREIAAEAGVSEGTIYNYYSNKRDLLIALIERIVTESILSTLPSDEEDPHAWLGSMLQDRLHTLDQYRDLMTAVTPEMINDKALQEEYLHQVLFPILAQFLPLVERFPTTHLRSFSPRIVLPAIMGGTIAAFIFNELADIPLGRTATREELITELVGLFIDGLLRGDRPDRRLEGDDRSGFDNLPDSCSPSWS